MNLVQVVVLMMLSMVLFFGIGFILNMLLKTTWLPLAGFFLLLVGIAISRGGFQATLDYVGAWTWVDYIPVFSGLAGVVLSSWAIRTLRTKGFRMF